MNILYVCTANICRSPSAEFLLRDATGILRVPDTAVSSAGVAAVPGVAGCEEAPALRGRQDKHRSRILVPPAIEWADLVLAASRWHQATVIDLDPEVRSRTFTVRQAGRLARWLLGSGMVLAGRERALDPQSWAGRYHTDDPRSSVSALSSHWSDWVLEELDAARGLAPFPVGEAEPDDVPDPHEAEGNNLHELAYRQIWDSTNALVTLLQAVTTSVQVTAES